MSKRTPTARQKAYWRFLKKRCVTCGYSIRKHCPFTPGENCSYYCDKYHHEFKKSK